MDYIVDTSDDKRLQLIRYIAEEAKEIDGAPVYVTPINLQLEHGITLENIQAVLTDLEEREYIEILQRPNHNLTDIQRIKRDDEEDYYFISVNSSFYDYSKALELTAPFHKSNTAIQKPQPSADLSKKLKIKYNSDTHELIYDNIAIPIKGDIKQEVCKRTFKNRKKAIACLDIIDAVDFTKKDRAVYDAALAINHTVKEAFGFNDLLIADMKTVRISQNYR